MRRNKLISFDNIEWPIGSDHREIFEGQSLTRHWLNIPRVLIMKKLRGNFVT